MTLKRVLLAGVGLAVPLTLACSAASAQSFNQFLGYGDSTIDSGWWQAWLAAGGSTGSVSKDNVIAAAILAGTNGAAVGAGNLSNSQILSSLFGLTAIPADQPGGTNYAISGALDAATAANFNLGNLTETGVAAIPPVAPNDVGLPSTVQQIANYLAANGGHANPNALYLISSGGNDTTFANDYSGFTTLAERETYVTGQAESLAAAITGLQAAGAQYIVVHGVGLTHTNTLNALQTQTLWSQLAANGVKFIPSDVAAVVAAAQSDPTLFGFTSLTVSPGVTGAGTGSACVWTGSGPQTGWAQWCANTTTATTSYAYLRSADSEQTSLYADNEHLSAAGQLMEADYDYSLIVAPSEISYLAEAPVKTRTAIIDSIFQQIAISERQRTVGTYNAWLSGDVSSLKMGNSDNGFPTDPGTPGMVTVGVDYAFAANWLVGAVVSVGTTTQSFSLGGNFRQNEYAFSAYTAYAGGPLWFDLIGSYGGLHYDVNRIVPIGIATISNTGTTNGSDASFAAEIGYNFLLPVGGSAIPLPLPVKAPPPAAPVFLTHGPVAGIVLQRINVDGFTETDPFSGDPLGGFTALSYAGQVRDSAVTELGYQASMDIGAWHPYAKVAWNHELVPYDRSVTASLTTISAPSYSMPAVILGTDWASATLGTSLNLGHGMTAYASFTSLMAQGSVNDYGGEFGLNVALNAPAEPAKPY